MGRTQTMRIIKILEGIESQVKTFRIPWVGEVSKRKDPYKILISCILSLRTRDKISKVASKRLFVQADTPEKMVQLSFRMIEKLIYPVGFFRNKAKVIKEVSQRILNDYQGRVPSKLNDLLSLKGVGRKTANLVLSLGYKIPAICVDTHVHRISNRLGIVRTNHPRDTEEQLKRIVPRDRWIKLNTIFVAFGQNICRPTYPLCTQCGVENLCKKVGVR